MSSSDASEITGLGLEQVVGEIPAAVFVIEGPVRRDRLCERRCRGDDGEARPRHPG